MPVTIRRITDLREAVAVGKFLIDEFHGAYRDRFAPVDGEKVLRYLGQHVIDGVLFVAEQDGCLVGAMAGRPAEYWWSTERFVNEGVFFVSERARASRAAVLLLKAMQGYADDLGLPLVVGVTSGDEVERKDRFFAKRGMARIGGIYHRNAA